MSTKDSLLVLGTGDEKLLGFLRRMGYALIVREDQQSIPTLINEQMIDLVLLDSRIEQNTFDLCEYMRTDEVSKKIPIVIIGADRKLQTELTSKNWDRVEVVDASVASGLILGRIATQLRLRKMAGQHSTSATLAEMMAAQRDVAHRLTRELDEARGIQEGLLPKNLPKDPRFEVAASYEPLEEVGGDWYIVEREKSGKLTIQIADVTGHGLAAAFIGSMTKLAFTASKVEAPDIRLAEMNRLMTPQLPEGRFVTMAALLYDPDTGDLDFVRAGHPPALHLQRSTGDLIELQPPGFAVGFFDESEYEAVRLKLEIDDIFLLITDGIQEAQNRSFELYGMERLRTVFKKIPVGASAVDALKLVLDDFDGFVDGRRLKDDTTLIVLRRSA